MQRGKITSHSDKVGLDLRDGVLPEAPRAVAHPVTKVADPAAVVLAHIEIVIVVEPQAGMTELSVALILRLLGQRQVPLQVQIRILLSVDIEQFWHKLLENFVELLIVCVFGLLHLLADDVRQ